MAGVVCEMESLRPSAGHAPGAAPLSTSLTTILMDQSGTPSPKATSPVVWIILVIVVLALAGGVFYVVSSDQENTNNANGATNTNAVANANGSASNVNQSNTNIGGTNTTNANTGVRKTYTSANWGAPVNRCVNMTQAAALRLA